MPLLPIFTSLILAGCLGGHQPVRPEAQTRSEKLLDRGIMASNQGNQAAAEGMFNDALSIAASIEDRQLTLRTLINQARLYRLAKQFGRAVMAIDTALAAGSETGIEQAELFHEKALLELALERTESAEKWARMAIAAESGDQLGQRLNLLARTMLADRKLSGLQELLNRALSANRGQNREEEANSLRMLGILARQMMAFDQAGQHLSEALESDKQLAISTKIAADLEELAINSIQAEKPAQAVAYLQRAYTVNLGGGRFTNAADNQLEIASLYSYLGDDINATKARQEATRLGNNNSQSSRKPPATTSPSSRP